MILHDGSEKNSRGFIELSNSLVTPRSEMYSCTDGYWLKVCLPPRLHSHEVNCFSSLVVRRRLISKGTYLFRTDDTSQYLYAVLSGSFKSCLLGDGKDEQVLQFFFAGDHIGLSGFDNGTFTCSAVALEDSQVCELPYKKLDRLCLESLAIVQWLHGIAARELSYNQKMLLLLGKKSAKQRVAYFFLVLSERFKQQGLSGYEFRLSMPRKDIANHLGLAIETVSRVLTKLHNETIIDVNGKGIVVKDKRALQALSMG